MQARRTFRWPFELRAGVSLCWDGGGASPLETVALLKDHGVRATFYLDPQDADEGAEAWRKAYLEGHEIGCRSTDVTALDDCTLAQMEQDLGRASDHIHRLVGVRPQTFAYPDQRTLVGRGENAKSYVPLIEDRFLAGRCHRGEETNDPRSCVLAELHCISIDGISSARMKEHVDRALHDRAWLIFVGHEARSAPKPEAASKHELARFLRYLLDPEKPLWLDTVEAIAGYIAQQGSTI